MSFLTDSNLFCIIVIRKKGFSFGLFGLGEKHQEHTVSCHSVCCMRANIFTTWNNRAKKASNLNLDSCQRCHFIRALLSSMYPMYWCVIQIVKFLWLKPCYFTLVQIILDTYRKICCQKNIFSLRMCTKSGGKDCMIDFWVRGRPQRISHLWVGR